MNSKFYRSILSIILVMMVAGSTTAARMSIQQDPTDAQRLVSDSQGEAEITWNPLTNTASFITGRIPIQPRLTAESNPEKIALAFIQEYSSLFGVGQTANELKLTRVAQDSLGMYQIDFAQTYKGVSVFNGNIRVHLSQDQKYIVASSNSFIPGLDRVEVQPILSAQSSLETAKNILPNGILTNHPGLELYPYQWASPDVKVALVWFVELRDDDLPARNVYVIDARSGKIIDVLDRLYVERNRETYDAQHRTSLPGTLARAEGDEPTGDEDIDHAHDFSGATYDYYFATHERDSYDGSGGTIISTANYGQSYMNAFWNGVQLVYGDGFPVEDVVAHEITHGVTEHTAGLEYRWQSGALNESISDIFGAMVDREDWLMGEDLPSDLISGRDAIRDLEDPTRYGQPAHTDDWVETCSDNEGVHTNSGIPNKAFYNIATAIGKEKAERIFYRLLTVYLTASSSLEDARAGAISSATDLYGVESQETLAVTEGFNAVGLDGLWNPTVNDCSCAVTTVLNQDAISASAALRIAVTLYQVRDQLLDQNRVGIHYKTTYEQFSGRLSYLITRNQDLLATGYRILEAVEPGLKLLLVGEGDQKVITGQVVADIKNYLTQLAQEDRSNGGGELADSIEQEMEKLDWDNLVGKTYEQGWDYLEIELFGSTIYMPALIQR